MICPKTRRLIEAHFVRPRPHLFRRLRPHLSVCTHCRRHYDALFAAAAALGGATVEAFGPGESELMRDLSMPEPPARPSFLTGILVPSSALAVAATLLLVLTPRQELETESFSSRGAGARKTASSALGLRLLCLRKADQGWEVRPAGGEGEAPRCQLSERLGFAARNETARRWHLRLLVLTPAGRVQPLDEDQVLQPSSAATALRVSIPLRQLKPGSARLFAAFSAQALDQAGLQRVLGDPHRGGLPRRLRALGVDHLLELPFRIGD